MAKMSDELKPGTEEFAQYLTELTTMDLLFAYKQEEISYGKDSVTRAILTEADRRDKEREHLASEVTDLTAKLGIVEHKLHVIGELTGDIHDRIRAIDDQVFGKEAKE